MSTSQDIISKSDEFTESLIQSIMESLQDILEVDVIESIEPIITELNTEIKSFGDFEVFLKSYYNFNYLVESLIADGITNLKDKIQPLYYLKALTCKVALNRRMRFMQNILKEKSKKEIFFSNYTTKEEINKRYRKLATYFHPDKTEDLYIAINLQEHFRNLSNELFRCVVEIRNKLLLELENISKDNPVNFHEEEGNKFWRVAIDYRNEYKAQWDKLKYLKKDLVKVTLEEIQKKCNSQAQLAYREYKLACKMADEENQLKSQIKLRGYMALSLYISNQFLEAQLYALSALNLLIRNSTKVTRQEFNEAKSIFDKVKMNPSANSTQLKNKITPEQNFENSLTLVKNLTLNEEFSFFEMKKIQDSINDDLKRISDELMLTADRSLVYWQANREEILHAKESAKMHKIKGGAMAVIGGVVIMAGACTTIGLTLPLSGGAFLIGAFEFICGVKLWKEGNKLYEEPKIREALNEIIRRALNAYDNGEHELFLNELSKTYDRDSCLLKLERRGDYIEPGKIVNELLKHGFRPDGIGYLLNLIGEVLKSGKIIKEDISSAELKVEGSKALVEVLKEKLREEAQKLDERIIELRKNSIRSFGDRLIDFIFGREYSRMANFYKNYDPKMLFIERLEEMRNTARINLIICDIINGTELEVKRLKKDIGDVRNSIYNHYQFFGVAETRLDVLDDFLWVVTCDNST